ncbi:hypothetical protein, partial [Citrobacter youngae]|uniref:hypothetical protein n=1 Tax=Citrobacter youngae TaxID=133448 RepID=UPI003EE1E901
CFHRIKRSSSGSSVDRKSASPPPLTSILLIAVNSAAGPSIFAAGVYLQFGLASSLIMSGSLLLLYALVVAMRGKNAA